MDIDEMECIRELFKTIIDLAVKDLKRTTNSEKLKKVVERNRESAEAFFIPGITRAAGFMMQKKQRHSHSTIASLFIRIEFTGRAYFPSSRAIYRLLLLMYFPALSSEKHTHSTIL